MNTSVNEEYFGIDQWGGEDLNDAEFAYYIEVQTRAYERLAEAAY